MLPTNPLLNATAPAGPHLPVALLRQYAAGTLAPAAQHRVEAHTLACPRCADILDGLLQTPATTTDQTLAQLQQRLRKRVQQAPQARPALGGGRQHRWLAPQLAAAATLLFGLVAGGWWTWQQRHPATSPAAALPAAQVATTPAPAPGAKPAPAAVAPPAASAGYAATRPAPPQAKERIKQPKSALYYHKQASAPARDTLAVAVVPLPAAAPSVAIAAPVASAPPASPDTLAMAAAKKTRSTAAFAPAPTPDGARMRAAMPAAPPLPATPVGGYPALREKLRREATKFVPEAPEQPVSGTVQLRLLIGADGKIQQLSVVRSLREDYDEEAQRLVCDGPGWVPGISAGRRAAQVVDIAVPFN